MRWASWRRKNGPIGLDGAANAASAGSTVTWVTTAAAVPGPSTLSIALVMRLPSRPCVIAPSSAKGCAGTMAAASCCNVRFPICGPLPCTIITRQPAWITAPTEAAISAALAVISSHVPAWPFRVRALPPSATTAVLVMSPTDRRGQGRERGAGGGPSEQ